MSPKKFTLLKNPSSWRRLSIATWRAPNDPTVYGQVEFDATNALAFLEKINETSPIKITMTHLVAKVIAQTLHRFPDLNGIIRWRRVYLRDTVDLFLQVAIKETDETERPDLSGVKIEACERKNLAQIAEELKTKSRQIREKKDPQFKATLSLMNKIPALVLSWTIRLISFVIHDLGWNLSRLGLPSDPFGSAMITSVGMLDLPSGFAPLVPMSRVPLIVCVGQVVEKPWIVDGTVVARPVLDLSVTFDHRFMDGLIASRMAKYIRDILANPQEHLT